VKLQCYFSWNNFDCWFNSITNYKSSAHRRESSFLHLRIFVSYLLPQNIFNIYVVLWEDFKARTHPHLNTAMNMCCWEIWESHCMASQPRRPRLEHVIICFLLYYGLDDRGSKVRFPAGAGNFSLHHRVQTGSEAHPASCPMGMGGGRGVKLTTHLHLVPRLKNEWSYTSTPQYAFMAWCSAKRHRDNFTFTLLYYSFSIQSHSNTIFISWMEGWMTWKCVMYS
jgi:hypothetical protein